MAHILIVCTANICRSPVAEALLQDRLARAGLADWTVSSSGTWALQARGASQLSIDVLADWEGLDISSHSARMLSEDLLDQSDLVLCMELGHAEALRVEFPRHAKKIYLLSQMVDDERYNIADPYGLSRPFYESMVTEVRALIEKGLPRIIALASARERQ